MSRLSSPEQKMQMGSYPMLLFQQVVHIVTVSRRDSANVQVSFQASEIVPYEVGVRAGLSSLASTCDLESIHCGFFFIMAVVVSVLGSLVTSVT